MTFTHSLRSLGLVVFICALSLVPEAFGLYSGVNRSIGDLRMFLSPKGSSGDVVFVAVDARSLESIGQWPWSRGVHAAILDRVSEGGATDVLFDFDFTFPSDSAGDRAFEAALDRAGGATMLATFEQLSSVSGRLRRTVNAPLAGFADRSWPALVNVSADAKGLVRDYPYREDVDGQVISSPAALISGRFGGSAQSFEIDFSIRPDSVPMVSAIDVINGVLPERTFAGRAVIVGAASVELSDQLAVPVHGVTPGPIIHALATETLMRNLELRWMRSGVVALILFGFLGLIQSGLKRSAWMVPIVTLSSIVVVELGSLFLFRTSSIQVPSAMIYPSLIIFGLWRLTRALSDSRQQLRTATLETRNTLNLLEHVLNDSSDGIIVLDEAGSVLRHSASAAAIFGTTCEGHLDLPERMILHSRTVRGTPSLKEGLPTLTMEIQREGMTKMLEYQATPSRLASTEGTGAPGKVARITTLVVRDVTRLIAQEQDIAYLSSFDQRTGALRRGAFLALLGLRLEDKRDAAVFALSLPRFKTVNVTLGRDVGDALLKEVVARLERSPLRLSSVARLGGTRFAFYTEGEVRADEVTALTDSVLRDLARPYELPDANAQVGALLGCTVVPSGSDVSASTIVEQAEEALDAAKTSGVPLAFYDHSAWEKQQRAREIERAMADALANDEFDLVYQPQHRVSDGALVGAEALLRWNSPTLGWVSPEEFISIAESTGFIVTLGRWTLERAARDAKTLPPEVTIAVNVSGIQLMQSDFAGDAVIVLGKVGLPASRICLELTETILLASTESIVETMQDLSFLGFSWALDDFGTGFSSMEYLSKMPLEKIKLDKSFAMRLGEDPTALPILHSTSELCRGLGVKLLCEGVETSEHVRALAEEGCAEAQGYLFGAPMSLDRFQSVVRRCEAGS